MQTDNKEANINLVTIRVTINNSDGDLLPANKENRNALIRVKDISLLQDRPETDNQEANMNLVTMNNSKFFINCLFKKKV